MAKAPNWSQFNARLGQRNRALPVAARQAAFRRVKARAATPPRPRPAAAAAPAAPSAGTPPPGPGVPAPRNFTNSGFSADETLQKNEIDRAYERVTGKTSDGTVIGTGTAEADYQRVINDAKMRDTQEQNALRNNMGAALQHSAAAGRLRSGATAVDRGRAQNAYDTWATERRTLEGNAAGDRQRALNDAQAAHVGGINALNIARNNRELGTYGERFDEMYAPEAQQMLNSLGMGAGGQGAPARKPAAKPARKPAAKPGRAAQIAARRNGRAR